MEIENNNFFSCPLSDLLTIWLFWNNYYNGLFSYKSFILLNGGHEDGDVDIVKAGNPLHGVSLINVWFEIAVKPTASLQLLCNPF